MSQSFRRRYPSIPSISALSGAGVYMSENINAWAAQHWQRFSTQNYFDPSGLFASVVFSGPLLLISSLLVVRVNAQVDDFNVTRQLNNPVD